MKRAILQNPELLPVMASDYVRTWDSTVIVAPHPDDETLGCGGAIALLQQHNCRVHILVMSDGSASHPGSKTFRPSTLRQQREQESQAAAEILGLAPESVTFLRLADKAIPDTNSPDFQMVVLRCVDMLRRHQAKTVLLPWRGDSHPDHRATFEIFQAVQQRYPYNSIEYPIWSWKTPLGPDAPYHGEVSGWRLDISTVVEQKRRAIQAHLSQVSDLIKDDPEGVHLGPEVVNHFSQPWELYLET